MMTPFTEEGLRKLDELPATDAVLLAWVMHGNHRAWHHAAQEVVREAMPVLGRALDRLAEEQRR